MSDHYFAVLPGNVEAAVSNPQGKIVVGTSSAGESYIELRVPDALVGEAGSVGDRQRITVVQFAQALREYFANAAKYTAANWPIGG